MGLLLFIIYILLTITCFIKKKSIFSITLTYIILAPQIKFGNVDFDAIYFVILYICVILAITKKKITFDRANKGYLILIFFNFILYLLMTLIKSNKIQSSGIASILGFTKIPLLILLFITLFKEDMRNPKNYDKVFRICTIINLLGVAIQFIFGYKVRGFFEGMYLTDNYRYYSSLSNNMVYNRKFGFFGSPMLLGIFAIFALVFFIDRYKKSGEMKNVFYAIGAFILGITSLSKTFILGMPILLAIYVFTNLLSRKRKLKVSRKAIQRVLIFILLSPILFLLFSKGYAYLKEHTTITYYLRMLSNPVEALNSRYNVDSNDILLSQTYEVINKNLFFGVGVQSVNNEFLGDSSYVLALHNGGILSLASIIIFYLVHVVKSFYYKQNTKLVFVILWIVGGLAMPVVFNTMLILPFYLYFFNIEEEKKKNENNEVLKAT